MNQEEIKRRLISGNVFHCSVQNLLSSCHLQSKSAKIRIYKNIILPVVLYGCETWSLVSVREQVAEKTGPQRSGVTWDCRGLHNDLYSSPCTIRVVKS
jgi:hypothetical protein